MNPQILNIVGLILDIIGATLLFFYGIQPALSRPAHKLTLGDFIDENPRFKLYHRLTKAGYISIVLGFVLQLISNIK